MVLLGEYAYRRAPAVEPCSRLGGIYNSLAGSLNIMHVRTNPGEHASGAARVS